MAKTEYPDNLPEELRVLWVMRDPESVQEFVHWLERTLATAKMYRSVHRSSTQYRIGK